ncbi:MAG: hypothetical protein HON70_06550, partial [Lentisphaerae bacterium]|nr:hypothetical protein [Lentisphaerota bacterium]
RVLVFDRDELFEAAAICRSMVRGEIDAVSIPTGCIDVLAQQIVGAVVTHEWTVDGLLQLLRRSYPYRALRRDCLEGVLRMLSGDLLQSMSRRPRPLVLWDHAGDRLTSARAAKLISAMNVGTIGETSEYEVVIEGTKKRVGKVQSEFADDQLRTGDIFVLGSTPWRVMGVHRNRILVKEAPGATPSVPWWTGPIPPRTVEAGEQVGRLRREVSQRLADPELLDWLEREYMMGPNAAKAAADYVREQKAAVDVVPDHENLLVETWRDELGRLNVIIHSPFGERTNRTWGLVLREAAKSTLGQVWTTAATNDHVLMTFPVPTTPPARRPDAEALIRLVTVGALDALVETVAQGAVGAGSTFREAATCALQIERMRQGRHVPIWLQNLQAEELFAAASLDGEHPILEEVRREIQLRTFDVEGLAGVLERIEAGTIAVCHQRVESPSPFAHSALVKDMYQGGYEMGRDRRAHLLHLHRRVLQQVLTREQMAELLDQRAIERIENRLQCRSERGRARTADELAQVLRRLGDIPAALEAVVAVTEGDAGILLAELCRDGRVVGIELPDCDADAIRLVPSELWRQYHDAFHHGRSRLQVLNPVIHATPWAFEPKAASDVIAARLLRRMPRAEARCAVVTRYLASHGPMTPYEIANRTGWPVPEIDRILDGLVESGSVAKGVYTVEKSQPQFVDRAVLEDIHRLTMRFLKRELSACAPYEVVDFMTRWQHVHPDTRLEGIDGLRDVIHQLQGIETVTGALESEVLANRVVDYNPQMLERLMASGEASWRCFGVRKIVRGKVALCRRQDAPWLSAGGTRQYNPEEAADQDIREEILKVRDYFATHPTAFFDDVVADTGVGADAVLRAVWYLAWCGEVTCDTYECLRHAHFQSTLSACYDLDSTPRKIVNGRMSADRVIKQMGRRKLNARLGRWSATERLLGTPDELSRDTTLRNWADQVLRRWGIVTRDMLSAETTAPAWGELLPELKRLELLGRVSRGYFIEHHHGEQYGLPDAIELLRDCRARRSEGNELGYLVDEPTFCVTTREPANLYASSFDIIDERGEVLPRTARRGNLKHRTVLQAGQVLVHNGHQTVTLSQEALRRCIEAMVLTVGAPGMELVLHDWNGFPLDVSPVAPLLYDAGFRFDSRGNMQKPPRGKSKGAPNKALQDVYLPYFAEPNPVTYGPEWTVGRAADAVQPVLQRLLSLLEEEWASGAWEMVWGCEGPKVTYRGTGRVHLYIARSFVQVCFGARAVTDEDGQRHQMATWRRYPGMRVKEPTDLTDEFRRDLHRLHEQVKALTDRYHASRGPRADGG